jgi:signal transduction histidine kinase
MMFVNALGEMKIMDKEELAILFIVLGILILVILNGFIVNYEKTECLKEGGKWVSGMIAGNYSYFCVPK